MADQTPSKHLPSFPFLLAYSEIWMIIHFQAQPSHGLCMWAPSMLLTRLLKPAEKEKGPHFKLSHSFKLLIYFHWFWNPFFLDNGGRPQVQSCRMILDHD